jgi:hypothetical protein
MENQNGIDCYNCGEPQRERPGQFVDGVWFCSLSCLRNYEAGKAAENEIDLDDVDPCDLDDNDPARDEADLVAGEREFYRNRHQFGGE